MKCPTLYKKRTYRNGMFKEKKKKILTIAVVLAASVVRVPLLV